MGNSNPEPREIFKVKVSEKPEVVVLCGSSRFTDVMAVCAWLLEREEKVITMGLHLLPVWYANFKDIPDHLAEHEGVADDMDLLHLKKIDLANSIFVINRNEYIGESTNREIEYARSKGKTVRFYTLDNIGHICEGIINDFLKRKEMEK